MSILEVAKVGNKVRVNLDLTKDRLPSETINVLNISSLAVISDFKITDGKGIGVILKLSNGEEQWFFEDEIDLLDENGQIIKKNISKNESKNTQVYNLDHLKYKNKNKISDLLNPFNFILWLIVSFNDIF